MSKEIEFVKAVASGNDFIIIDRLRRPTAHTQLPAAELARQLCPRKLSVGADGLLLIEPAQRADFKMRIFNPDGTEVNMCGNGSRCVALYAVQEGTCANQLCIETAAGNLQAEVKSEGVKISMPPPKDMRLKFKLNIEGRSYRLNYINTGVPHIVWFVREVDKFAVQRWGRAVREHPRFHPAGTNVNFVQELDKEHIKIRTYERGLEEESLSCGTGAVAAALITLYAREQAPAGAYKIRVDTQSGECLRVYFHLHHQRVKEVYLEGRAKIVYRGKIRIRGNKGG